MNVTLRQLQIFETVATRLSFTRASEFLHLSQPAVSMQVKLLEQASGMPLFEREGKQLRLTDTGTLMLKHAASFRRQMESLHDDLARLQGAETGVLRLAVPSTANAFVALFVAEFCRRHPQVDFTLTIANRMGLLNHLADNDTDLVIMGQPPSNVNVTGTRFMGNPLVVIAPPDHPLAKRRVRVPLSRLVEHEFVVREPGSGTRIAIERFCAEHNVKLKTSMEVSSNESIRQMVAAGLGLGIVSLHTLELELHMQRVVQVSAEAFPIMRYWYLVQRDSRLPSPVAASFRQFVMSEGEAFAPMAPLAAASARRRSRSKR